MDKVDSGEIWRLLFETSEKIRNYHTRHTDYSPKNELTFSQIRVISCIFISKTGIVRVKDLAEELAITPGGVSQLVDSLVNAGFLTRCRDEHDRRAVCIGLSEYGLKVRAEIQDSFAKLLDRFMINVSEENRAVLREVMISILKEIKNIQTEEAERKTIK